MSLFFMITRATLLMVFVGVPALFSEVEDGYVKIYTLEHPATGLVMDATKHKIQMRPYKGTKFQHWTVEHVDGGRFLIRNVGNRETLDLEWNVRRSSTLVHSKQNQTWFLNHDNTIVLDDPRGIHTGPLAIDVLKNRKVVSAIKDESEGQQWILQPVN